jgi:hypothetical protein
MLRIVLLICSMTTPRAECTQETAYSVTQAGYASTPYACLSTGQTVSAAIALSDERVYSKVTCDRVKFSNRVKEQAN